MMSRVGRGETEVGWGWVSTKAKRADPLSGSQNQRSDEHGVFWDSAGKIFWMETWKNSDFSGWAKMGTIFCGVKEEGRKMI